MHVVIVFTLQYSVDYCIQSRHYCECKIIMKLLIQKSFYLTASIGQLISSRPKTPNRRGCVILKTGLFKPFRERSKGQSPHLTSIITPATPHL